MRQFRPTAAALPALLLPAFLLAGCETLSTTEVPVAASNLVRADGSVAGTVRIFQQPAGLLLRVDATGLPPGRLGVHVHETGRCDPPGFTTAGAHWNPTARQHGHRNPQGYHLGDLGNVGIGADGRLIAGLLVPGASLWAVAGGRPALRDANGSALVIHARTDDEITDPSGNSGDRIACAIL